VSAAPDGDVVRAPDLDVETLRTLLGTDAVPVVVDTRSRREYEAGHIPGAIHLPFWRAGARHHEIGADRDAAVVLYCGHGPRAAWARALLRRRGYRRVGLLKGHFRAWRRDQ
jgi:rhodanese-related sulfurtransferase